MKVRCIDDNEATRTLVLDAVYTVKEGYDNNEFYILEEFGPDNWYFKRRFEIVKEKENKLMINKEVQTIVTHTLEIGTRQSIKLVFDSKSSKERCFKLNLIYREYNTFLDFDYNFLKSLFSFLKDILEETNNG